MEGKFMVSFDVESLFANIPFSECIDLAVDFITKGNPGIKLSTFDLKRLFLFATAETMHFIFSGTYYDQVDGVAMGSSLAPVFFFFFFYCLSIIYYIGFIVQIYISAIIEI